MNETSMESTAFANDSVANEEGTGEDAILGITPLNLRMLLMAERYKNLSALNGDDDLDDLDPTTPIATPVMVKKPTSKWGKLSLAVVGNKPRKNSTFKNLESSHASSSSSKENAEVLARHLQEEEEEEEGGDTTTADNHEEGAHGPMGETKQDGVDPATGTREGRVNSFDEEDALEYWDQLTVPVPPPLPPIQQALPAAAPTLATAAPIALPTTTDDPPPRTDTDISAPPTVLSPLANNPNPLSLVHPSAINNNNNNNNQAEGQELGLGQGPPESSTGVGAAASSSSSTNPAGLGQGLGQGVGVGLSLGVNAHPLPGGSVSSERVVMVPALTVETLTFVPPPPPTFEAEFDIGSQGASPLPHPLISTPAH